MSLAAVMNMCVCVRLSTDLSVDASIYATIFPLLVHSVNMRVHSSIPIQPNSKFSDSCLFYITSRAFGLGKLRFEKHPGDNRNGNLAQRRVDARAAAWRESRGLV